MKHFACDTVREGYARGALSGDHDTPTVELRPKVNPSD